MNKQLLKVHVMETAQITTKVNFPEIIQYAKIGNIEGIKEIIVKDGNLDYQDNVGWTALIYASLFNQKEIVKFLLENGANVNLQNHDGNAALTIACLNEHTEIIQLLLENGADANLKNNKNITSFPELLSVLQKFLQEQKNS